MLELLMSMNDYEKVWKLANYKIIVTRSPEIFIGDDKQKHLNKCRIKHKGIVALFDSLSDKAKKGIEHKMENLNKKFEEAVGHYKETFSRLTLK